MRALLTSADVPATRSGIGDDRRDRGADDDHERPLEPGTAKPHATIDEQRADPSDDEHGHEEAIELELERKIGRKRVPADRDEQDDEDQRARAGAATGRRAGGSSVRVRRVGRRSRRRRRESAARVDRADHRSETRRRGSIGTLSFGCDSARTRAGRTGRRFSSRNARPIVPAITTRNTTIGIDFGRGLTSVASSARRSRWRTTRSLAGTRFERCCCSTYRASASQHAARARSPRRDLRDCGHVDQRERDPVLAR